MSFTTRRFSRLSDNRDLARYLIQLRKFPQLNAEEECALAKLWQENQDQDAADRLITSHLALVVKVAIGFGGYGLPISELIAEGNIGIMLAINRFDPHRGFRFSTYSVWWIRAAIQGYILHNWSLVKIGTTTAQKKLFFRLRRTKERIEAFEDGDLSSEQVARIANWLNVPGKDVVSMNRRLAARDSSLNAPVEAGGEGQDWLVDDRPNQEIQLGEHEEGTKRQHLLGRGLATLNARERHILVERHLKEDPVSLKILSQAYGVSDERVRQIEVVAFRKLQKAIRGVDFEPIPSSAVG
jgi:RNA polymerase sigma-32 factor